jgi:hypothetical protein
LENTVEAAQSVLRSANKDCSHYVPAVYGFEACQQDSINKINAKAIANISASALLVQVMPVLVRRKFQENDKGILPFFKGSAVRITRPFSVA